MTHFCTKWCWLLIGWHAHLTLVGYSYSLLKPRSLHSLKLCAVVLCGRRARSSTALPLPLRMLAPLTVQIIMVLVVVALTPDLAYRIPLMEN